MMRRQQAVTSTTDASHNIECVDCKNSEHLEAICIKEEVEQDLIGKSVHIDNDKSDGHTSFPLIGDPVVKLAPNCHKAQKMYELQMKHLERSPEDKQSVIKSEVKLQQLGFVEWVKNLSEESQKKLRENDITNFLPWRVVLKENSITSPSQMVFDGSQRSVSLTLDLSCDDRHMELNPSSQTL